MKEGKQGIGSGKSRVEPILRDMTRSKAFQVERDNRSFGQVKLAAAIQD